MSTMRGGGMGLSAGAERSPRAGSSRARAAELPKRKPNLKALWPEIKALVAPRKGLLIAGMALMAVNRLAGLVLPYTSKTLLDKVLSQTNPHPELLPKIIALVFFSDDRAGNYVILVDAVALKGRSTADC